MILRKRMNPLGIYPRWRARRGMAGAETPRTKEQVMGHVEEMKEEKDVASRIN